MSRPAAGPKAPLSRRAVGGIVVAVILAVVAGATIGSQFAVISCGGGCVPTAVALGVVGAAFGGVGTAIIGLLVARAFVEWDDIKRRQGAPPEAD